MTSTPKIVVIGPCSGRYKGGIAHFTSSLAKALKDEGPVKHISWSRLYPPFLSRREFIDRTSQVSIGEDSAESILSYVNPLSWWKAARSIARFKADKVVLTWVHPVHAPVYLVFLKMLQVLLKCETVLLCHNVQPHESFRGSNLLSKWMFKSVDRVIVHSKSEKEKLAALTPTVKALELFHPIYEFPVSGVEDKPNPGYFTLLFFGLIRPYKGLDILLEAMTSLSPNDRSLRLIIAGEGFDNEDNNRLRQQVKDMGLDDCVELDLRYIPNEDVSTVFCQSDIVILPYRSATSSGPLTLAYFFNKPVIATNVGGLPDYVDHERSGLICEPNSKSLAEAIVNAQNQDWDVSNIHEKASNFSWRTYAKSVAAKN